MQGSGQHQRLENDDYTYPPPQERPYQGSAFPPTKGNQLHEDEEDDARRHVLNRTPSPTPSEARELRTGPVDWKSMTKVKYWFRKEWLWYYVALVAVIAIAAVLVFLHKPIVDKLTKVSQPLKDKRFGWLVPIGILFVISFPPLFGHEIVAPLCGLIWGLWAGFAIVAAGTLLGEIGNFYAFRYCCRGRAEKQEKKSLFYGCLARVVRDGGFRIALIVRLSAVPGHFTTAIFATCGMNILVFIAAALLTMPKQLITVYLGVLLEESNQGGTDAKGRTINIIVLIVTVIITFIAMWYILNEMHKVTPVVIYERRKARQAKLLRASNDHGPYMTSSEDVTVFENYTLNPPQRPNDPGNASSDTLTAYQHQQWDENGKAVGYTPLDPTTANRNGGIIIPQPRRSSNPPPRFLGSSSGRPSTEDEGLDAISLQTPTQTNYQNVPRQYFGRDDRPGSNGGGSGGGGGGGARPNGHSSAAVQGSNPWAAPPSDRVPAFSAPPFP